MSRATTTPPHTPPPTQGLLARHATFISEDLAATGLLEELAAALDDRNEAVRRARYPYSALWSQ